jgi:hypothetical protein
MVFVSQISGTLKKISSLLTRVGKYQTSIGCNREAAFMER